MKRSGTVAVSLLLLGTLTAQTPPGGAPGHRQQQQSQQGTRQQEHRQTPPRTAPRQQQRPQTQSQTQQRRTERQQEHRQTPPRTAPRQQQRPQTQSQTQQRRTERRRPAPHIERYRGPQDYRPGRRPRELHRRPGVNLHVYRHNYRAERRYRVRPYMRPRGWYFHRWVYGEILPRIFWTRHYWLVDYWLYGLPIPPYGYTWVRYGNDALLINQRTGEILQVIYDVFY